jgi:uncharacterized protein YsxB (DUF464 family)
MLEIIAKSDEHGIFSVAAQGHTGYEDSGSDVVCAAVSALMQALWIGLEDVLKLDNLKYASDPDVPMILLEWDSRDVPAQYLARTIILTIKGVAASYEDFVGVVEISEEEPNSVE